MRELYLAGLSMLTPIGADSTMVKAAVDVGMNTYQDCDLLVPGEAAVKFSPVPAGALKIPLPALLPVMSPPQIRLLQLAAFALADIEPQLPAMPIPLFLAGPEPYYPQCGLNPIFIKHLLKATGVSLDLGNSRYIATGRSGVIEAIVTAFKYFAATNAHYALVGGVDSFYDIRTLGILEENKRLPGENSYDGFVPGEAAAFLLLVSPKAPESVRKNSLAILHEPAIVRESGHLLSDAPYTAEAMANAVRQATARIDIPIDILYTSENGEMHYTREMTVANLRNQPKLSANYRICRPAECFGDIGAASAAVAIGLASVDIKTAALICASADGGPRGAICVSAV